MAEQTRPAGAEPGPSPQLFFDTLNAFQRTEALRVAVEMDLFTAIGEGAGTAAAIARRCKASERGTRILCDALTVLGFLAKGNEHYALTPDSAVFLDRRSPAYAGGAVRFLTGNLQRESFAALGEAVRRGGTALAGAGSVEPENPVWVDFARGMGALLRPEGELLAKLLGAERGGPWKVIDIAAGHGMFGIEILKANPRAQVVAIDWAMVLEVARENAAAAGVADRLRALPGDAFQVDFGSGFDLVLIPNFLHHFDARTCEGFLRKVHAALRPGGRAAIVEFIPNADRVTPPTAALFSLIMLAHTPAGDAYTYGELESMCRNAGFTRLEHHHLPPTFQDAVIAHR